MPHLTSVRRTGHSPGRTVAPSPATPCSARESTSATWPARDLASLTGEPRPAAPSIPAPLGNRAQAQRVLWSLGRSAELLAARQTRAEVRRGSRRTPRLGLRPAASCRWRRAMLAPPRTYACTRCVPRHPIEVREIARQARYECGPRRCRGRALQQSVERLEHCWLRRIDPTQQQHAPFGHRPHHRSRLPAEGWWCWGCIRVRASVLSTHARTTIH
eukprot:2173584-Prymnesium_polylepis.1